MLNNTPDIVAAVEKQIADNSALRKQVEGYMLQQADILKKQMIDQAEDIRGTKVIRFMTQQDPEVLKAIVPYMRGKFGEQRFLLAIGNVYDNKPSLTLFLSQPLVDEGLHAGKIVREAAKYIQGGGGGQAFMATAGGKYVNGLDEALDFIVDKL